MNDEEAFQAALDARPNDHTTRLVFADWLQDRGDERAEGYRMMAFARMVPAGPKKESQKGQRIWWWLETIAGRSHNCNVKSYWHSHLTTRWVESPEGCHPSWSGERVAYLTRREAEDNAARAWMKVSADKRHRDLRDAMNR